MSCKYVDNRSLQLCRSLAIHYVLAGLYVTTMQTHSARASGRIYLRSHVNKLTLLLSLIRTLPTPWAIVHCSSRDTTLPGRPAQNDVRNESLGDNRHVSTKFDVEILQISVHVYTPKLKYIYIIIAVRFHVKTIYFKASFIIKRQKVTINTVYKIQCTNLMRTFIGSLEFRNLQFQVGPLYKKYNELLFPSQTRHIIEPKSWFSV